jgi:hypothetical protein
MRIDKRHVQLRILFQALGMMYTFYLLGAGASAGVVPLTRELKRAVVTRYRSFRMYPVERMEPDPVFERVIGDPTEGTDQITGALSRHLFPSAVHAMVLQQLALPQKAPLVDQYGLFLRAAKPSTFFNMNDAFRVSLWICPCIYLLCMDRFADKRIEMKHHRTRQFSQLPILRALAALCVTQKK